MKKLNQKEKEEALLNWLKVVVLRYKDYPNIKMWQVENEPFLTVFGECEKASREIKDGDIAMAHLGIWSRKDPWAPAVLEQLIPIARTALVAISTRSASRMV